MVTDVDALEYLKGHAPHFYQTGFEQYIDVGPDGRFNVGLMCDLNKANLIDIPFKFGTTGLFHLENAYVKDLTFLPKRCQFQDGAPTDLNLHNISISSDRWLMYDGYIPALFTECAAVVTFNKDHSKYDKIGDILTNGRINGRMPRELIPSKINELRSL
jgi:hypothetical protein